MKKVLLYLVLIMAVTMAGIVAYVSVNGLLKVFTGAGTLGLLLFSSIEFAKVVATSAIHTYGKKIGWVYNLLLSVGIFISMVITSMGIYGFLSTAYQESFNSMKITENKIELIEGKSKLLEEDKTNINKDIQLKRDRISKLIDIRSQQEVRLDSLYNKNWYTAAKKTEKIIAEANDDIKVIEKEIDVLTEKMGVINDSINSHSLEVIELNQNNEGATELNSLKYLSTVTGKSMDEVMKWFILLLIIIGDPMAVLMVIVFNKIMNKKDEKPKVESENLGDDDGPSDDGPISGDTVDDVIEDEPSDEVNDIEVIDEEIIDAVNDVVNDAINDAVEEIEKPKEHKKITRGDIKELRDTDRGFSVNIPKRKNNNVSRIGTNKIVRKDNPGAISFKRRN